MSVDRDQGRTGKTAVSNGLKVDPSVFPHSLQSTNADLKGVNLGRQLLDTPCLVVDLGAFENNIALAARMAQQAGKQLWPHVKAHKSVEIAKRQFAAGAAGISVASIGEAEVFAAKGLGPILITSTIATDRQIQRVAELIQKGCALTLVSDNADFLVRLDRCLEARSLTCDVLVDIDMGRGRAGCVAPESAVELALIVEKSPALKLKGVQAYAGHLSHMGKYTNRAAAAEDAQRRAEECMIAMCNAVSRKLTFCSGGSTGASQFDIKDDHLSALQWGSYVFMDVEYKTVEICDPRLAATNDTVFRPSLFVATRVISANHPGRFTMDAGDKRFASKYGASPEVIRGASAGAKFTLQGDEHGLLEDAAAALVLGSIVELIVPHCDPTVNLFDYFHVVEGENLVDIWRVDARGVY